MRKLGVCVLARALTAASDRSAEAQRRVTGVVTGPGGEPLGSAGVNVQGTTIGTYTSDDGRFSLNSVPAGSQVVVVRRIGYRRTTAVLPATQDAVNVQLQRDVLELEKQVITSSSGTGVSSINAANAVSVVTGSQLTEVASPTIENALQGKISGAVVTTNSGAPGGGAQVQLRGVTSINSSSSPLYVVDGVVVSNQQIGTGLNSVTNAGGGITNSQDQPVNRIADLNPDDVESIEVLKGASSGAIYGSKASNGVIVITTKRGQTGAPQFAVAQRVGQFSISRKLGSRCFGSQAEAEAWFGGTLPSPFSRTCHDYEQEYYSGNPLSYETDVSVRGGSAGTTYYLGGLAKRDNAIGRNSYYQKQSITANLSQLLFSRLTLRANNEFIHSLTDRGIHGNDNSPIVVPVDIFSNTPSFFDLRGKINGQYQPNPYLGELTNPFQDADLIKNPEDVYRYIGSVSGTLSAYTSTQQTLDFTVIGGLDTYQFNSRLTVPPEVFFATFNGLPGTIVTNRSNSISANLNVSAQHKLITDPFTGTTTLGIRQGRRENDLIYNQGRNVPSGTTNIQNAVVQSLTESNQLVKDFAYYAKEELLTLNERMLLTVAANAERSSVNGDDKKFYTYPQASASYRVPILPFGADEFKLRVAYGKAGNQPSYGVKYTALVYSVSDASPALVNSTTLGNAGIKPETSTETEGGFDLSFIGGRLGTNFTVYRKKITDLILAANVAPTTGYRARWINGGEFRNTGTEIDLNAVPVQTPGFSWLSRASFAKNSSRVVRLDVPCANAGAFFSVRYGAAYLCQGYSTTAVQVYNGYDSTFVNGVYRSRRRHSSIYDSAPKYTLGWSNEFKAGPFRLYGLLDYRNGGKVANLTNNYFDGPGADNKYGLAADTALNRVRLRDFRRGYGVYLEDATFLKLRELSLSYTIPKSYSQRFFGNTAEGVRAEISGRNLKSWQKYTGYDPEVSNFSNQNIGRFQDVTPYPPSRSVFFSLSANF
ncbi:MAG: TonB-dependent receptor [Gemmatimonadaceae bacterium]